MTPFTNALRSYGTVFVLVQAYLMLVIRTILDGKPAYKNAGRIVVIASLLWLLVLLAIAILAERRRSAQQSGRAVRDL